jgi:ATP-dependent Lhr-like helicase
MTLDRFHPAVRAWFEQRFPAGPSAPQRAGWPAIRSGTHTLIAAPTGSGKTLAAFLWGIDELIRLGLDSPGGILPDETRVIYVSPLKALGNDIAKNLREPLDGIRAELRSMGLPDVEIRVAVRTGDTPPAERQAHLRKPPHLFVTTPESLYILLTTRRGREMLQTARTVIVDEIHAVADDKRGSHLALTLERLDHLTTLGAGGDHPPSPRPDSSDARAQADLDLAVPERNGPHAGRPPGRIGLSATVRPIEAVARFLVGARNVGPDGTADCVIVDEGHVRAMELAVEIPGTPLEAVASAETWEELYDRLSALIAENRTTLVFVNTRRLAERVTHHLSQRIGEENVTSHHGSLSRERRLDAEERLKEGRLKALVATASLELGIDIGTIDLVCQIGSPHTIAALLQRVGRSGRLAGALARGRLFALSRDELIECAALLWAARRNMLDRLEIPEAPLDILAQQIVAASVSRDWALDELYDVVRGAWPFRDLERAEFDQVVRMLAEGYATTRRRRGAWIHLDEVNGRLRGRKGARIAAVTSGGAIPDTADYDVVLDPEGIFIGTVNEDFAIESLPGDIFQLGNASWEILRVETGRVRVADAQGKPPTIPFWLGEAPGRTPELSELVSRIRAEVSRRIDEGAGVATRWLVEEVGLAPEAALQVEEYLAATKRVLGVVPTQEILVLERFFDEAGGMQLVLHAPFGSRINRAWGLALRKKFCRSFNFELQAAANEDAIVLSLGPQHSFPLIDVFRYLKPETVRETLVQALLPAPMFQTRWRWNAERSLAILRMRNGQKTPAQLLRMQAEDLLAAAFPHAAACPENLVGDIEVPWEHAIVRQTVMDCLTEAMDIERLEAILASIERGERELVARDVPEPSPMTHEILNARPYAFLDDAPLEERRTMAVSLRRNLDYRSADDLGTLSADAIERVRQEAWPEPTDADEVHEALVWLGLVTEREAEPWREGLAELVATRRAAHAFVRAAVNAVHEAGATGEPGAERAFWIAAERLPEVEAAYEGAVAVEPAIEAPVRLRAKAWDPQEALAALLVGRLEGSGPVTIPALAFELGVEPRRVEAALIEIETTGQILRGRFTPGETEIEWCHRRLLSRIHRYTIDRLRAEIEPAAPVDFLRFLFAWQYVAQGTALAGPRGVLEAVRKLQAFEAPAIAWEREILPARVADYEPAWLDELCLSGTLVWGRLTPPSGGRRSGPVRATPVTLLVREDMPHLMRLADEAPDEEAIGTYAREVLAALGAGGAAFHQDLVAETELLPSQVEEGLGELVAWGLVTADGFSGLRALLRSERDRRAGRRPLARAGRQPRFTVSTIAGRWSLFRRARRETTDGDGRGGNGRAAPARDQRREEAVEAWARILLARYGVVARRLLDREPPLAPWREVVRVLRRLEMRGEIRGGRFLHGAQGEQFALPEAVESLRATRRKEARGELVVVNGGDPLNLVGIVTPGERVAALSGNRVVYRDGVPLAAREGRATSWTREAETEAEHRAAQLLLLRGRVVPAVSDLPPLA